MEGSLKPFCCRSFVSSGPTREITGNPSNATGPRGTLRRPPKWRLLLLVAPPAPGARCRPGHCSARAWQPWSHSCRRLSDALQANRRELKGIFSTARHALPWCTSKKAFEAARHSKSCWEFNLCRQFVQDLAQYRYRRHQIPLARFTKAVKETHNQDTIRPNLMRKRVIPADHMSAALPDHKETVGSSTSGGANLLLPTSRDE
eukprot:scaffold569_cov408-Prasinococcus_capsulatus_cf.AAC.13